jgi:hypothetical protein
MPERIERELTIAATVAEVWDVVTTDGWLADEVAFELCAGGEAWFRSGAEERRGWVEDVRGPGAGSEDQARLCFWWAADAEAASRVELTIDAAGDELAVVRVAETRPLELLDLVGIPLPGNGGQTYGPALVAA